MKKGDTIVKNKPEIFFRRVLFEKFPIKVAINDNINLENFWYAQEFCNDYGCDLYNIKFSVRECYNNEELKSFSLNKEYNIFDFREVFIVTTKGGFAGYAILKRHVKK